MVVLGMALAVAVGVAGVMAFILATASARPACPPTASRGPRRWWETAEAIEKQEGPEHLRDALPYIEAELETRHIPVPATEGEVRAILDEVRASARKKHRRSGGHGARGEPGDRVASSPS